MNQDESINNTALDIFITMSNSRKSKGLKSDRVMEPRFKVLDGSKFDCERQLDKSNISASYLDDISCEDGPGESLPTERAEESRVENMDELMNDIVDLDNEVNQMMKQIQDKSSSPEQISRQRQIMNDDSFDFENGINNIS